jgi:D-alanine-D-alanine ligase
MVDTPTPIRITVIHGDPSKPNIILPGGKWDEDDFDALFRTKAALSSLKNYKVSYLCDHDKLWEECKKLVGNTDLILQFCDEGYMNNPRMELHVIAILEMLGLPFSGTGPVLGTFLDKCAKVLAFLLQKLII